jgi:hypothetical protein
MWYTNWRVLDGILKIPIKNGTNGEQQIVAFFEELIKIDGAKEVFEKYGVEFKAR